MLTLKETVEAVVYSTRAMMRSIDIPIPTRYSVLLKDTLDTLEWIVKDAPWNLTAKRAQLRTVEDCADNLAVIADYSEDVGYLGVSNRLYDSVSLLGTFYSV